MLPHFIFSSYKQYKADTDMIASWLASTAEKLGYVRNTSLKRSQASRQEPKLKGRARKLARDAAAKERQENPEAAFPGSSSASLGSPSSTGPVYIIAIQDFVVLAEYIAKKCKSTFRAPDVFALALDRAIQIRKEHNAWFRHNTSEDPAKLDRHSHFVSVLQQVRDILKPHMPKEGKFKKSKQPEQTKASASNQTMANMFEGLDVKDPSDVIQMPPTATSSVGPSPMYQAEEVEDPGEARLAIRCLFEDLQELLDFVRQMWSGCDKGEYQLTVTSLATNTAIHLVKEMEEDFLQHSSDYKECGHLIRTYYEGECAAHSIDISVPMNSSTKASAAHVNGDETIQTTFADILIGAENYDIAEKSLILTFTLMNGFRNPKNLPLHFDSNGKQTVFEDESNHPGLYNPFPTTSAEDKTIDGILDNAERKRDELTWKEKWLEDLVNMVMVMPELYIYSCHFYDNLNLPELQTQGAELKENFANTLMEKGKYRGGEILPAEDEFTKAVRLIISGDHLSMWSIFAAQVFLTTRHEMRGSRVGQAFCECIKIAAWQSSTVRYCTQPTNSYLFRGWAHESKEDILEAMALYWSWLFCDMGSKLYRTYGQKSRRSKDFRLFKYHPLLCGLVAFDMKFNMQELMTSHYFENLSITSAAHLYYNLRRLKPELIPRWTDMDLLWHLYGTRTTFYGGPPTKSGDAHKRWLMSMGIPLSWFDSRFGKRKSSHVSAPRHEKFEDFFPVSQIFKARNLGGVQRGNYTTGDIEKILRKQRTGHRAPTNSAGDFCKVTIAKPSGHAQIATGVHGHRSQLTPVQLLRRLCDAVQWEDEVLSFDMLELHVTCSEFLGDVYERVKDLVEVDESTNDVPSHVHEAVDEILRSFEQNEAYENIATSDEAKRNFKAMPVSPDVYPSLRLIEKHPEILRRVTRAYKKIVKRVEHERVTNMYPSVYNYTVGFHVNDKNGNPTNEVVWKSPEDYESYDRDIDRAEARGSSPENSDDEPSDGEGSDDGKKNEIFDREQVKDEPVDEEQVEGEGINEEQMKEELGNE